MDTNYKYYEFRIVDGRAAILCNHNHKPKPVAEVTAAISTYSKIVGEYQALLEKWCKERVLHEIADRNQEVLINRYIMEVIRPKRYFEAIAHGIEINCVVIQPVSCYHCKDAEPNYHAFFRRPEPIPSSQDDLWNQLYNRTNVIAITQMTLNDEPMGSGFQEYGLSNDPEHREEVINAWKRIFNISLK